MRSFRGFIAAVASGVLLAGCAAISSVPAGPAKIGSAQVTLGREWSDVSALMNGRSKKVRLLTIDGPLLNRLYISDGLSVGDHLVKPAAKERPTPVIRADMSVSERIEFVIDSISAMDFQRVEASRPRPAKLDQNAAVRFDVTAKTKEGLEVRGTALSAEVKGKTYVVIYLAPTEHYYEATLPEIESIMASGHVTG